MTLCAVHRAGSKANRPSGRTGPGRLTPLAIRRALFADRFLPRYRADLLRVLRRHAAQVADEALVGMPDFAGHLTQWEVELSHAKKRYLYAVAALGWRLAGIELGLGAKAEAAKDPWALWWEGADPAADPATAAPSGVAVGTPGEGGGFLLRGDFDSIDKWITTTSLGESRTSAKRFREIWEEAAASFDPKTGRAWTAVQIRKEIERRFGGMIRSRANMLARTGTVWAINEGAHQRYRAEGVAAEEWVATADDATCPYCLEMDGKIVAINEPFWGVNDGDFQPPGVSTPLRQPPFSIEHPPLHPNCLIGETPVVAPDKVTGLIAAYSGPVIEVTFADSRRLTVTPNHMLLTPRGFARAASLREGDDVVDCSAFKGVVATNPNDNRKPPMIKDVVEALAKSRAGSTTSMPVSPVHLHGDAAFVDGKVNVIAADSLLRNDGEAIPSEPLLQSDLGSATVDKSTLDTERNLAPVLLALSLSTDGGVGVRKEGAAFFQREPLHSEFVRLTTGAYTNAGADETPTNTPSADIEGFRDRELRLPMGVTTARVTGLCVRQFSGHVYDLQSSSTLYTANGLVSSNCRCTVVPVLLDSDEAVPVREAG